MKLREWNAHLHGLVVFRALLNDPVVARLLDLTDRMEAGCSSYGPVCDAVAAFEAALFEYTTNWGSYLSNAVLEAETICVRQAAAGEHGQLLPAHQRVQPVDGGNTGVNIVTGIFTGYRVQRQSVDI